MSAILLLFIAMVTDGPEAMPEPPVGGTVVLIEGTCDIRKVEGALGGVVIDRSKVTLAGTGAATQLAPTPHQSTHVIRIIGRDLWRTVLRDLPVDANRDENAAQESSGASRCVARIGLEGLRKQERK